MQARSFCRLIDRVTVKGSKVPVELHTFDIVDIPTAMGCYCDDPDHYMDAHFDTDPVIPALQEHLNSAFKPAFTAGVAAYLAGAWDVARQLLMEAKNAKPDDGPSTTLLEFMGASSFVKPIDWDGFRELTEK